MQAEAAERGREAEELRQQLSSGTQHADALAAAQSQAHDLEQQLSQLQAALQQEASTAQQALQVCPSLHRDDFQGQHATGLVMEDFSALMMVYVEAFRLCTKACESQNGELAVLAGQGQLCERGGRPGQGL